MKRRKMACVAALCTTVLMTGCGSAIPDMTEEETQILSVLERSAKPLDEVIAQLDMPAAMVKMRLTKLSVKGIVVMHPGGRVSRK